MASHAKVIPNGIFECLKLLSFPFRVNTAIYGTVAITQAKQLDMHNSYWLKSYPLTHMIGPTISSRDDEMPEMRDA